MASLVLYGSTTADATLTNARVAFNTTGGVETSYLPHFAGSLDYGEVTSHNNPSGATVSAIPSTPTGWGWTYPIITAGTFAAGTWTLTTPMSSSVSGEPVTFTLRFFKYSGGTYTAIGTGSTASANLPTTRAAVTISVTSSGSATFASGDILYWDLWLNDTTGAGGDEPTMYVSSSSSAGVSGDMQVTTTSFTPAGPALNTYTVTEQDPNELETVTLLGAQSVSEQAPTYVETIIGKSITLYPAIIEQAPTAQEIISVTGVYIVSELTPPTAQESVSDATPYVVSELTPPTAQESVSITRSLTISELTPPTAQESISLTQNKAITEQAVTYTETVTVNNIVPTISYTVNDVSYAIETVSVTNSIVLTLHSYTVNEQAPPTALETVTFDPISQSLPNAPMTQFDLEAQYSRIEASALVDRLQFCAITYYSSAGATKILEGEIDALLDGEDISMLHELRTINDVNSFIYSYDYMSSVFEDNPLVYLRLGDGAGGSAADISGNAYNGATNGIITTGQSGAIFNDPNSAMLFGGGYITLPTSVNTTSWGAMSIELWFNLSNNTFTNYPGLAQNGVATSSHTGFDIILAPASDGTASGYASIGLGASSATIAFGSTSVFAANQWYHLVLWFNGSNIYVFINGVNVTLSSTSASGLIAPAAAPIYLGAYTDTTSAFNGLMDEIAIYPYALDPARIAYRYQIGTGIAI